MAGLSGAGESFLRDRLSCGSACAARRDATETAAVFQRPDGKPFTLYRQQEEAIHKALAGESFVVTSGTGSGKEPLLLPAYCRQPDPPAEHGRPGGRAGGLPHECAGELSKGRRFASPAESHIHAASVWQGL